MSRFYSVSQINPPSLHEKTGISDTESHMSGPLGEDTQAGGEDGINHNHLT